MLVDEIYKLGRRKLKEIGLLDWCESGNKRTIEENRNALDELLLVYKVFHHKFIPNIKTNVFGFQIDAPFAPASVAGLSKVHPDGEKLLVSACSQEKIPIFLNNTIKTDIKDLVSISSVPVFWVLKPLNDINKMKDLIKRAEDAGVKAIGINVDVIYGLQSGSKIISLEGVGPSSVNYYRKLRETTSLPVFIKGLLHPDDCKLAVDMGYDGIVLSNHGGRVLDYLISPIRILPEITKRFGDSEIMVDSGFRYGIDIYKALVLGAKMVLIGRPILYALAAGGEEKLIELFRLLKTELMRILGLMNSRDLESLDSSTIRKSVL